MLKMKTLILTLVLTSFLGISNLLNAQTDRWIYFDSTKNGKYYYDNETLVHNGDTAIVWIKHIYKTEKISIYDKIHEKNLNRKKMEDSNNDELNNDEPDSLTYHSISKWNVFCDSREYIVIDTYKYNENDILLSEKKFSINKNKDVNKNKDESFTVNDIVPESIEESLYYKICK